MTWIAVGLGGALGAIARFGIGSLLVRSEGALPLATLLVNVLGAGLLGFLVVALAEGGPEARLRLFLGVGFLGAFTTFSTFAVEILALEAESGWTRAGLYAAGSVALGVGAALAGMWLATAVRGS